MSIYTDLLAAGVPLDSHESDLYAKQTPTSAELVADYRRVERRSVETFQSALDGSAWYCLPFAYDPFWERVQRRAGADNA